MFCAQKSSHLVKISGSNWKAFGDFISKAGESIWLGQGASDTKTRPSGKSFGSLEERRKRYLGSWLLNLILAKKSSWLQGENVDRRDVWRYGEKHGFNLESSRLRRLSKIISLNFCGVFISLACLPFGPKINPRSGTEGRFKLDRK